MREKASNKTQYKVVSKMKSVRKSGEKRLLHKKVQSRIVIDVFAGFSERFRLSHDTLPKGQNSSLVWLESTRYAEQKHTWTHGSTSASREYFRVTHGSLLRVRHIFLNITALQIQRYEILHWGSGMALLFRLNSKWSRTKHQSWYPNSQKSNLMQPLSL